MSDKKVLSLTEFLVANPQDGITEEFYLSKRFQEAGFKFKIASMSGDQFSNYQKEAMSLGRHKKVDFDSKRFNELVVLNHTIEPNFKSATFLAELGVSTPEQAMYKVLKAGEILDLSTQISKLSGFEQDPVEDVETVKNS